MNITLWLSSMASWEIPSKWAFQLQTHPLIGILWDFRLLCLITSKHFPRPGFGLAFLVASGVARDYPAGGAVRWLAVGHP